MILTVRDPEDIRSFAQLYYRTTEVLLPYRQSNMRTVTFGPITAKDEEGVDSNLRKLSEKVGKLSTDGWIVFDIVHCHLIARRLIRELRISGYPFTVLEDFTLPLIRNGWFSVVHIRTPFHHSIGASREYQEAKENRIPVRNFR